MDEEPKLIYWGRTEFVGETLTFVKILISKLWLPGVCSVVWYKPVFERLG
jgi:hypothetical protein